MSDKDVVYLDTSALAKWYLNEVGSDAFEEFLQSVNIAVISTLTRTEMRSLLARRRRMQELDNTLEISIFTTFHRDIQQGHLQLYPVDNERFVEAEAMIGEYPQYALRTLDALHLAVMRHYGINSLATADRAMTGTAQGLGMRVFAFD